MPVDLTGQVVLISGAGGGLGRSAARYLARCGAVVGVNDINAARCEDTCALITRAGGVAHSLAADLSSREAFLGVAVTLAKTAGRIDAVVNNASLIHYEKIEDVRERMLETMLGIGLKAIYSAKGSLVSLTRTLAAELGPRGVRVNAVAPGSVPTPGAMKLVDPAEYERRARSTPRSGEKPNELYKALAHRRGWEPGPAYIGLGFSLRGTAVCDHMFGTLTSPGTFGNYGAGSAR
jgi:3-oxoacyl-[acyl-carrier protein] reductase